MKITSLLLVSFLHLIALSQKKESYYDFYWKPCSSENARYYSVLEKTDSGWFRNDFFLSSRSLQMQSLFEDEACKIENGFCRYFYANGNPLLIGREIHGKQEGICIRYYSNGMMSDSALFHEGRVVDKRFKWHRNGYMSDSISRINDSTEVQFGWFDDGALAYAGFLVNGKQNAKWKYFYHNGKISSLEIYENGKITSAEYFDESGQAQTDTSTVNREANFKGGPEAWKKYLEKNLYWPINLQFSTNATITVGVDFTVDENGKLGDVEVSLPFHPGFDAIALKIVKNCPAWIPAIEHNRKVKAYRRQPISFKQSNQ
jgi:TonB family protein